MKFEPQEQLVPHEEGREMFRKMIANIEAGNAAEVTIDVIRRNEPHTAQLKARLRRNRGQRSPDNLADRLPPLTEVQRQKMEQRFPGTFE